MTPPAHPNAAPVFTKATRKRVLLRMAISGPSGSGKTYTALTIGQGLAEATGLRLAVIDTENGSAEKYADLFDFDHLVMSHYAARNYIAAIDAAQDRQHSVLVIDSLSHAWSGVGGTLDTVDRYASGHRGDSFGGWREARPEQRELVDVMLKARLHIIVTMRSKQAYEIERDQNTGRNAVRKLGLKPEQTDGIEYEFDVAGDMEIDHRFLITKTRAPALNGRIYNPPGPDLVRDLLDWIKPQKVDPAAALDAPPATAPDTYEPDGHEQVAEPTAQQTLDQAPDTRKITAGQLSRLHAMLANIDVVEAGHLDKHDLCNYALRQTGRDAPITTTKDLTRSEIEVVFGFIDWLCQSDENKMRGTEAVAKWAAAQPLPGTDEVPG